MMIEVSIREMIDSGVHFGHQTHRWNPKMKPFIYGARSGIHILDLSQTQMLAGRAFRAIEDVVSQGLEVLFVGTKDQAQLVIEAEAKKCGMPHVTRRWLGGMLTNFATIRKSVERLLELESRREKNDFAGYTKKERLDIDREIEKLLTVLGGIKHMKSLPGIIFVVDPHQEDIAIHEANTLGIPIVALTDTNCDPDPIEYPIPANDDAVRSIQYFTAKAVLACLSGLEKREALARAEDGDAKKGEPKKRTRLSQPDTKTGKGAYVSKADTFETAEGVETFSATVTPAVEEPVLETVEKMTQETEEGA